MYKRTFWKDHITDSSGEVIQQGTALNQENFNNIETGVFESQVTQDINAIVNRLQDDENKNNTPFIIKDKTLTSGTNEISLPAGAERNVISYTVIPVLQASGTASVAITATQKNGFTAVASAACTVTFIVTGGML